MPGANEILGLMRAGVDVDKDLTESVERRRVERRTDLTAFYKEIAENERHTMALESPVEVELTGEYAVVEVTKRRERGNPLIAAVVAPLNQPGPRIDVLLIDRTELPGIASGTRLYLTEFSYGDSKAYRETYPR